LDTGAAPRPDRRTRPGPFAPTPVALSPDGKRLAWGVGGAVRLWDVAAHKELTRTKDTGAAVVALAFAADSRTLASLESDGTVRLWDDKGGPVRSWTVPRGDRGPGGGRGRGPGGGRGGRAGGPGGPAALAFLPDGKTPVGWSALQGRATVWDVATGKEEKQAGPAGAGGVFRTRARAALSADGRLLAVPTASNVVGLVDLAAGRAGPAPAGHAGPV